MRHSQSGGQGVFNELREATANDTDQLEKAEYIRSSWSVFFNHHHGSITYVPASRFRVENRYVDSGGSSDT